MFKFFLLAACVATTLATSIPFELCPTPEGTAGTLPGPLSFTIPECSQVPCGLAVGDTITLLIGIAVDEAVTSLPVSATVTSGGVTFPFPLPNGDACAAIATGCPSAAGNYMVSFPVQIGGVNAGDETTVRVQINNQAGRVIACGSLTTTFA